MPAALICASIIAVPAHVVADDLESWSRQVKSDPDYKVRLSAGLRLGRLGDPRAVPALTDALGDKIATVRTIAASALAKLAGPGVPTAQRAAALAALRRLATEDPVEQTRKAAATAIKAFEAAEAVATPRKAEDGIFVALEPVSDMTSSFDEAALAKLTTTAKQTLLAANETFLVEWPGGGRPTRKQLTQARARAIVVLANLTAMEVTEKGKRADVACKLNLILASYPQKAARTFLDGKAKLNTSNSSTSIESAKTRCATDIVKHLMGSRLVPDITRIAR